MNQYLNWIDEFLEEADTTSASEENSDVYTEASEETRAKLAAAKLKAGNAISIVAEKIKTLIDNIIQKIRELSLQLQVKFTQLKFKQALKKVGRDAIKEIKANPNISKQGKTLAAEGIKLLMAYEEKVQKIAAPFYAGKKDIEEFADQLETASDRLQAQFNVLQTKLSVMDDNALSSQTCMAVANSVDASIRDIVGAYNRTIVATNKKLEEVKKKGVAAAKASEPVAAPTPAPAAEEAPAKTPSRALTITSKVASAISSAVGVITSFIHKILSKIAAAGDKAIRSVASATASKKSKKVIGESAEDESDDDTSLDEEYDESWEDEIDAIIASL